MVSQFFEPLAGAGVLLGLWMVGLTNIRSVVTLYSMQSFVLGLVAAGMGSRHGEPTLIAAAVAVILIKGLGVPIYLTQVIRKIGCRRDEGLLLAPPLLLFLTVVILGALVLLRPFSREIPIQSLPGIGIVMIGMVLMVSRRLAVSQILGFLVLENGIFFYTVTQPHSMPIVVELGVLLDVLVGTMLAGLLAFRIRASFEHIDVAEMKQLKG